MVRLLAGRDHAHAEAVLLERELAILRSQRQSRTAKTRLHHTSQERSESLQLMRLRGWSAKETAALFIVTDHGGQIQMAFHAALAERCIKRARSRVRSWQFNSTVERLFWSLKRWRRLALLVPDGEAIRAASMHT